MSRAFENPILTFFFHFFYTVCDKLTADLSPVKTAFQKRSVDMRLNVPEIIGGEIAVRKEFKHMVGESDIFMTSAFHLNFNRL